MIGAVVCIVMLASACSKEEQSKTTMPTAWRSPTYDGGPFSKLFIIGIGKDDARRKLYEDSLAGALESKMGGFDAVVITRLLGIDDETEYVEGESHLTEASDPDLYLTNSYELVNTPGYYQTKTTFRLETALYAVDRGERVWSGLSHTVNPESVEEVIESVSATVAKRIKSEGFVP